MKNLKFNIEKSLYVLGVKDIQDISVINGDLYFVKTKDSTYTYDAATNSLEQSFIDEESIDLDNQTCKLTMDEKNKIAEENLALIHYVLKGFLNTGIDYDELESVGNLGFVKALNSFDKMKNIRFSTYAINCITNEILFFLRKEKKHILYDISLQKELGTNKNGNALTLEETLEDETFSEMGIDFNIMRDETKKILLKAIQKLNDEEQYIILYRYGVDNHKAKTQKQLADELHMSQANISKLQKNCLKKLKFILQKEMNN